MFRSIQQTLIVSGCLGIAACILSLLLTRFMLTLLPKLGIVDKPDFKRHIHKVPVPRGGGIAMVIAFATVLLLSFGVVFKDSLNELSQVLQFLCPLLILVPLGIIDDKYGLRAKIKFFAQIAAAFIAWYLDFRLENIFGFTLPVWLSLPVTIFWIVGFINAFNMIDGVDGLASGIGIISSISLAIISISFGRHVFFALLVVFAGSLFGFLYYNWHPARLFMGDTGSMFIGYVLSVSGLVLNARIASVSSILIPLLACGIPFLDIIFAVWRRIIGPGGNSVPDTFTLPANDDDDPKLRKNFLHRILGLLGRLGTADQRHLHHRMLNYFKRDQKKTVLNIYSIAAMMGLVAIVCCYCPTKNLAIALVLALGTFSYIINRLAFVELWQTTEVIYHNFQTARAGIIITYFINPLADLILVTFGYYCVSIDAPLPFFFFLRYLCIIGVVLVFSRSYRAFWNFAVSDDYLRLIVTIFVGFALAWLSDLIAGTPHGLSMHFYAATIAVSFIAMERLGIHYFRNAQSNRLNKTSDASISATRTLLVGVTSMTRLYRNQVLASTERSANEQIVGIAVLNKYYLNSYCYGIRVLGDIDHLAKIIDDMNVTKIVLVQELPKDELIPIKNIANAKNIKLTLFLCREIEE